MITPDKKDVISKIRSGSRRKRYFHFDIPEIYEDDLDIIYTERDTGIRTVLKAGFDVITNQFFVEENILCAKDLSEKSTKFFSDFDSYSKYLDGDIYHNAFYYQCNLANINISQEDRFGIPNTGNTIDDSSFGPTPKEINEYQKIEKTKGLIKKWVARFVECDSLSSLKNTVGAYLKSPLYKSLYIGLDFFFWQYVFYNQKSKKRFNIIMKYMSTGEMPSNVMIRPLCYVYAPSDILKAYNYSSGSPQTRRSHNKQLEKFISQIDKTTLSKKKVSFNPYTHYYCETSSSNVKRYFESFDELIKYREYDLSNCDLSNDFFLEYDFSKCKVNENTKLPYSCKSSQKCSVKKEYYDGKFFVTQEWTDTTGKSIKKVTNTFDFFYEFVSFLKGDLSGADLLLCDGLANLTSINNINFSNAKIPSRICDKLGIKYSAYVFDKSNIKSFNPTIRNEKESALILNSSRDALSIESSSPSNDWIFDHTIDRFFYITDLHLLHKLQDFSPKTKDDIAFVVQKIVSTIVKESKSCLLIGGDVSSSYDIFELFVKLLRLELDRHNNHTRVIFTLGNHELWDFQNESFSEIVSKYDSLLKKYGMVLLQNNLIYRDANYCWHTISADSLSSYTREKIRNELREARIILFGGLAFSGCNTTLNADSGLYKNAITKKQEILESQKFTELYNKLLDCIPDKRVIILTHMPIESWNPMPKYHEDYYYISGHTHKNYFYDDGEIHIYADNQIGYKNNNPHTKWFEVDNDYDYFCDYNDGIHEITRDDYYSFCRGKNIQVTYERDFFSLYMLKNNGYYCFIQVSNNGKLAILNGGQITNLAHSDINYYFDHMTDVISKIRKPLSEYQKAQDIISSEVKRIGGSGKIHGCIIDVDPLCHIYLNPFDGKITGYWALNIIDKIVFPDIPSMLKQHNPLLYANYLKLLEGGADIFPTVSSNKELIANISPEPYKSTDIYKVSRLIKKMQKLDSHILTTWPKANNDHLDTTYNKALESGL